MLSGDGSQESPFTDIMTPKHLYELDKKVCIKELQHIAKTYRFKIIGIVTIAPTYASHEDSCAHNSPGLVSTPKSHGDNNFPLDSYHHQDDDMDMTDPVAVARKTDLDNLFYSITKNGKTRADC